MKSYIKAFVLGMIGVVIVVSLLPTLLNATASVSGDIPILANSVVGTVAGAGILLLLVDVFI
jgi:hypothetical protein